MDQGKLCAGHALPMFLEDMGLTFNDTFKRILASKEYNLGPSGRLLILIADW